VVFIPLPCFIRSRSPTPLLSPSLVLFPPSRRVLTKRHILGVYFRVYYWHTCVSVFVCLRSQWVCSYPRFGHEGYCSHRLIYTVFHDSISFLSLSSCVPSSYVFSSLISSTLCLESFFILSLYTFNFFQSATITEICRIQVNTGTSHSLSHNH
jgi:hypothetical protein